MKRAFSVTMAAAITALAALTAVPRLSGFASTKNQAKSSEGEPSPSATGDPYCRPLISYGPGDERVPTMDPNAAAHAPEEEPYSRPLIIYEPGDERIPTMDPNAVIHVLEEQPGDEYSPVHFVDLERLEIRGRSVGALSQYDRIYTHNEYYGVNPDGYIFLSFSGLSAPISVSMIECESGEVVQSRMYHPEEATNEAFAGDPAKYYYFMLQSDDKTITGYYDISWHR